jgi:hypothetical protein
MVMLELFHFRDEISTPHHNHVNVTISFVMLPLTLYACDQHAIWRSMEVNTAPVDK